MDDQISADSGQPGRSLTDGRGAEFRVVRRGYDPAAVDARVVSLQRRIYELEVMSSPQAAVDSALEQFGEEVSGIIQRARETAAEITATAQREADDLITVTRRNAEELTSRTRRAAEELRDSTRQEAAEIVQRTEQRVRELDLDTEAILAERERIINDARDLARQLLAMAQKASDRFPAVLMAAEAVVEPD